MTTTNVVRKNAWNNGGTFDNPDLLWYAKAVGVMKSRPISDPTSWWFYAAIHGQCLISDVSDEDCDWRKIGSIPPAALATLPTDAQTRLYWDQCQHGTSFFAPWHRGYLAALENLLRDIIVNQLKGPEDWALPYWNYLNQDKTYPQYKMPPAFNERTLPDKKTPNPLYVPERYGPNGDGNIYIVVEDETQPEGPRAVNDKCQWKVIYTGIDNYGGPQTEFSHNAGTFGKHELNPHNNIHVLVGGHTPDGLQGLMSYQEAAALDPIFFVHHSNVDRMWTAWNVTGKNPNPEDDEWLLGPLDRKFAMPLEDGKNWEYTPEDMNDTTSLKYFGGVPYAYSYDDLALVSHNLVPPRKKQLVQLGSAEPKQKITVTEDNEELVGGNSGSFALHSGSTQTSVKLDAIAWKPVPRRLEKASAPALPKTLILALEGVKGSHNSNFLSLYVNGKFVDAVGLFGISRASVKHNGHGGAGLTFRFDITDIISDIANSMELESLNVEIKTVHPILKGSELTVGKISIYRED